VFVLPTALSNAPVSATSMALMFLPWVAGLILLRIVTGRRGSRASSATT
jgi:hypothetical protein